MGSSLNPENCWQSGLAPSHHSTQWTADRAIDWLRHGRDTEKPFCNWVSFADLQHPYVCPEPWSAMHDPEDVDLPAHRTLNTESMPGWYRTALGNESSASEALAKSPTHKQQSRQQSDKNCAKLLRIPTPGSRL